MYTLNFKALVCQSFIINGGVIAENRVGVVFGDGRRQVRPTEFRWRGPLFDVIVVIAVAVGAQSALDKGHEGGGIVAVGHRFEAEHLPVEDAALAAPVAVEVDAVHSLTLPTVSEKNSK